MKLHFILLTVATSLTIAGCAPTHVAQPVTNTYGQSTPEAQMDFWHTLAEAPVTSNDDAFHGLLLSIDGTSPDSYQARVDALKAKGMLPSGFSEPGDQAITRGVLSRAVAKHLGIRGGVANFLSGGNTKRYSTRELVSEGILPPSTPNQTFSGAEFVGFIGAVEDYSRGGPDAITGSLAAPTPNPTASPDPNPSSIQRQVP